MKAKFAVICVLFVANSAFAEETAHEKEPEPEGLGLEQKLANVYKLYSKGDSVSLESKEIQVGVNTVYTTGNQRTFGLQQSVRALTAQVFGSYGFGKGTEFSLAVPFSVNSQRVETTQEVLAKNTLYGVGDATARLLVNLPTKKVNTTAILSATLPTGKDELSRNDTHTSLGANWNKVLRPAFVSGGASWERDWQSGVNGLGYNVGMGFFLNHALSLGGEMAGVLVLNPEKEATPPR